MSDSPERYVPQGDLATRGQRELAAVGLSSVFPARMRELNDGLTYLSRGTFAGLRFNLRPDEDFPSVDVEAKYLSPYQVTIDAGINKRAQLAIRPSYGQLGMLAMLTLDQVKVFTNDYPTSTPMSFSAAVRTPEKPHRGRELQPIRGQRLADLSSAEDLERLGLVAGRYDVTVGFETKAARLAIGLSYVDEPRTDAPVFMLHEFTAADSSATIEMVVGTLGRLVKQNWNIPRGPQSDE